MIEQTERRRALFHSRTFTHTHTINLSIVVQCFHFVISLSLLQRNSVFSFGEKKNAPKPLWYNCRIVLFAFFLLAICERKFTFFDNRFHANICSHSWLSLDVAMADRWWWWMVVFNTRIKIKPTNTVCLCKSVGVK